jgi:chemotaxis response regulator CheB
MTGKLQAVAIGASAGGVAALSTILAAIPETCPLPILVVLHLPADKKNVLPELLQAVCRLAVREAEDKEPIAPATVYLAPLTIIFWSSRTAAFPCRMRSRCYFPAPRSMSCLKRRPTPKAPVLPVSF